MGGYKLRILLLNKLEEVKTVLLLYISCKSFTLKGSRKQKIASKGVWSGWGVVTFVSYSYRVERLQCVYMLPIVKSRVDGVISI